MDKQRNVLVEYPKVDDGKWEDRRRILMLACSERGYALMQRLREQWAALEYGVDVEIICKVKCNALPALSEADSLEHIVGAYFDRVSAIIFFAAAGIAVRCIAPHIGHKSMDPAVIVLDGTGHYCIPLLSGHAGGANELARQIAACIGAQAVITTATDCENKFAVDEFARKNGLAVTDWKLAKEISAEILNGKQISLVSEYEIVGNKPEELDVLQTKEDCDTEEWKCKKYGEYDPEVPGIIISCHRRQTLKYKMLQLVPRCVVVGIGCRRDTDFDKINHAVMDCLEKYGLHDQSISAVTSVDLKQNEPGILRFCEMQNVPFVTYRADELRDVQGNYSGSDFVEQIAGVDCVCERSAVLYAQGKEDGLICRKTVYDGVTVALALREIFISFD